MAIGTWKWGDSRDSEPLPEGANHYEQLEEVPWDIKKSASGRYIARWPVLLNIKGTFSNATRFSQDTIRAFTLLTMLGLE